MNIFIKIIMHIGCFVVGLGMLATFPFGVVIAYREGFRHPWKVCWRACTSMLMGNIDKFIDSNSDE